MRFLLPLIIFGTAIGIFFLGIDPLYEDVQTLRARIGKLDDAFANSQKTLTLRDTLLQKYDAISQENLRRLERILPMTVDNVRLMLEISRLGTENSLVLKQVEVVPSKELNRAKSEGLKSSDFRLYDTIGLEFTLAGTYSSFRKFLDEFEKNVRISDIKLLSFGSAGVSPNEIGDYRISVETYWLKQ